MFTPCSFMAANPLLICLPICSPISKLRALSEVSASVAIAFSKPFKNSSKLTDSLFICISLVTCCLMPYPAKVPYTLLKESSMGVQPSPFLLQLAISATAAKMKITFFIIVFEKKSVY